MSIGSVDDYIISNKQRAVMTKTATRTAVAGQAISVFDLAGQPGAGVLAATNATSGVIPTDADIGYPTLLSYVDGASGYLTRLAFSSTVACRLSIYDRVFLAGAFPFNAAVTLTGQPAITRGPGRNVELWIEWVTASTGNPVITVTYTNELGVAGRTTGAFALGAAQIVGRCTQMPLQAGDNGVTKIETVTCTGATAGTFNMMLLRSFLADGVRVRSANDGDTLDMLSTGLQNIYDDCALYLMVTPDSTNSGIPSFTAEIASL
jgi:hypothetical protein